MSVKHTFEISSTYRNRLLYPSQYEFAVNISESKHSDTSITALNPISLSYPIYNFQGITNNAMIGSDISGNPIGTYLKDYREGRGMPRNAKILAVSMIILFAGYAVIFAIDELIIRIIVAVFGLIGIFYVTFKVPVTEDFDKD